MEKKKFDPKDKNATVHFNPFDLIKCNEKDVVSDVQKIAQIFIDQTKLHKDDESYIKSLSCFLELAISYVLLEKEGEERNFYVVNQCSSSMLKKYFKHRLFCKKKFAEKYQETLFEYCCSTVKNLGESLITFKP